MFLDPPFFGVPEVQTLSTACTAGLGGYFTVSYADYEVLLPGNVSAVPGDSFITTTEGLAPFLRRGDIVKVGEHLVTVAQSGGVLSRTKVPLSAPFAGPGGPELPVWRRPTTEPIPFDVTPTDLKNRLQHLYPIGIVTVTVGATSPCGARTWHVTFVSDENSPAPKQTLVVNGNLLTGTGVSVSAGRTAGVPPKDYMMEIVNATASPSYLIRSLTAGACVCVPSAGWCLEDFSRPFADVLGFCVGCVCVCVCMCVCPLVPRHHVLRPCERHQRPWCVYVQPHHPHCVLHPQGRAGPSGHG
jgi:hypothetical protein